MACLYCDYLTPIKRVKMDIVDLYYEVINEVKELPIGCYDESLIKSIKFLLNTNRVVEINFNDDDEIPRLLSIENYKWVDSELGIIPIITVILGQILDNGIYVEEDNIDFPPEMAEGAIDCFIECYWKKDTLSYEGERMTLKEIRDYSIHYVKHQVVDTVDSNKNSLAKEILCY